MGGRSSSSNTTNTEQTNGQNAIQGDNLGVAVSGVSNSNINVTATDHGAIQAAKDLGEMAINGNTEVTTAAIDMGENVAEGAMELSLETSEMLSDAHSENLQYIAGLAGNQAAQNSENLKMMGQLISKKMDGGAETRTKYIIWGLGLVVGAVVLVTVAKEIN